MSPIARLASAIALMFWTLTACTPGGPANPAPVYRVPILETVVEANGGARIVPEAPDGSYTVLPVVGNFLRFRLQADVNLRVSVGGVFLPRRAQSTATSGWFEPNAGTLKSGSRNMFWDIAMVLPASSLGPAAKSVDMRFDYDVSTGVTQPGLNVTIRLFGRDPAFLVTMPRPSDVFVNNTDNAKPDNAIAARGVTLAGWLHDPHRNSPANAGSARSEDWHYDIFLDPDFIERNYASLPGIQPITSATLPGNAIPIRGVAIPLLSTDPALATSKPTAAAFTMPGNGILTVELNAWHNQDRGARPSGWVADPDPAFSGNSWPFDPRKGTANITTDLKAGDYVIVSGTLWQDTGHAAIPRLPADFLRKCIDERFVGHGGWLEIHPVDAVHRVESPSPRRHVVGMAACNPGIPSVATTLSHATPPPSPNAKLMFEVIVDDRFTSANATHSEAINQVCEPPVLAVSAAVSTPGSFNATYILWWEETSQRRTGTAICLPAAGNVIIGGAPW